jgi:hypothetical protein
MNDRDPEFFGPAPAGSLAFLAGGGELGALIRTFNWRSTPRREAAGFPAGETARG